MSTSRVDVGTPVKNLSGWIIIEVKFYGFTDLSTTRGVGVRSPQFSCFGHQWILEIYPGGKDNSNEGYSAVALFNRSDTSIKIQYGFSVRDADGKELCTFNHTGDFAAVFDGVGTSWYYYGNFAKRSNLITSGITTETLPNDQTLLHH